MDFNLFSEVRKMSEVMSGIIPESRAKNYVSPFKKAIKDYQDEVLTGLTEEERKEIDAKLDAYRKECVDKGMDSKAIQAAVNHYHSSLLKEYGAKFDIALNDAIGGAAGDTSAVQGAGGGTGAAKSAEACTADKTNMNSEVQTDADGTVYLLVTSPNGICMKIKIGNEGDGEDDLLTGGQKAKKNSGVMDYERNIDAFFEEISGKTFAS